MGLFLKETGKLGEGDAAGSLGDLQREMSEDLSDRRTNRSCMIRSINVDRYVGHGTFEYLRFARDQVDLLGRLSERICEYNDLMD